MATVVPPEIAAALPLAIDRMLESEAFKGSGRAGSLLKFLVERMLAGDPVKELTVGAEGLGRGPRFDPRFDSIVRVEISRLRSRLALYYATEGAAESIRITVPKGSYAPIVERREQRQRPPRRLASAAAIAVAVALVGATILWLARPEAPLDASPATRFELDLGDTAVMRSTQVASSSVVISPDGREVVFVSFRGSTPRLMAKRLDELDDSAPRELTGTDGARGPFFSPDGQWIGFAAAGKLWKTHVMGGERVALCDAHELLGASWGDDGLIVAALSPAGLVRIPSAGGAPEPIAGVAAGARWPQVLPGSGAILYTTGRPGPGPVRIEIYSAKHGAARPLVEGSYARYLASGHLAWVDRGELLVAPFHVEQLELMGNAQPLVRDVAQGMYGSAEIDVSETGTLVYRRSPRAGNSVVEWIGADGDPAGATHALAEPAQYFGPRLSPDGARLAYRLGSPDRSSEPVVRIADARSSSLETLVAGIESAPVWTPDGRFIIGTGSGGEIRFANANGTAASGTLLSADGARRIPWSIDAAGERLAFYERGAADGPVTFDLWTVPITVGADTVSAGRPEPLVISDYFEVYPSLSPDGRWVAYTSLESGAYEIYVRDVAGEAPEVRVSDRGGVAAFWSRDGRRLFYQSTDQRLMTVDLREIDARLQAASPRPFSEVTLAADGLAPSFDVAPDGRVVALVAPRDAQGEQRPTNVSVVIDVFAALRRSRTD
jgi:serine/threonine-protein kinase